MSDFIHSIPATFVGHLASLSMKTSTSWTKTMPRWSVRLKSACCHHRRMGSQWTWPRFLPPKATKWVPNSANLLSSKSCSRDTITSCDRKVRYEFYDVFDWWWMGCRSVLGSWTTFFRRSRRIWWNTLVKLVAPRTHVSPETAWGNF